jgi:hypothetical protein
MYSTVYSCQILIKLEFSGQIFEKYFGIKFHENPLCERSRSMRTDRRIDKHEEVNSRFWKFCDRA